jgi:hypothetical protein
MSPDPSGLEYADPKNPQGFNLYAYVRNNPLIFIDPTGLWLQFNCYSARDTWDPETNTLTAGKQNCTFWDDGGGQLLDARIPLQQPRTLDHLPQRTPPVDCTGYSYADPLLGAVEVTAKVGPEGQVGPIKLGFSLYKNLTTGQTGGKAEANAGLLSIEADNPTPEGGSLNGGGPQNIEWKGSLAGFAKNFTTGKSSWDPSKSLSLGLQLVVGMQFTYNSEKAFEITTRNERCGVNQ